MPGDGAGLSGIKHAPVAPAAGRQGGGGVALAGATHSTELEAASRKVLKKSAN